MGHLCPNRCKDWSVPQDWGQCICVNASFLSLPFFRIVERLFSWVWNDSTLVIRLNQKKLSAGNFLVCDFDVIRRIYSSCRHSPLRVHNTKQPSLEYNGESLRINSFHSSNSWKPEGIDESLRSKLF